MRAPYTPATISNVRALARAGYSIFAVAELLEWAGSEVAALCKKHAIEIKSDTPMSSQKTSTQPA